MRPDPRVPPLSLLVCGLGLLGAACGDDDTLQPPVPVAHVSLTLRVEPATEWWPDPPYVITATATNDGDLPVDWELCSCEVLTRVSGPYHQIVQARPPITCTTACGYRRVKPGEVIVESYPFTGVLYSYTQSGPVDAPPGTYTVDAFFTWYVAGEGSPLQTPYSPEDHHYENRRQTFDWPAR